MKSGQDGEKEQAHEFLHVFGRLGEPGGSGHGIGIVGSDDDNCPMCKAFGMDPFEVTPWEASFDRFTDAIPDDDPPTEGTARVRCLLYRAERVEAAAWNEALKHLPWPEADSIGALHEASEKSFVPLLTPWGLYHEPFRDRPAAKGLMFTAPSWVLLGERSLLRRLVHGRLSAWTVTAVAPGASLTLADRFSDRQEKIDDEVLSPIARAGDLVLARVVTAEGVSFLNGWCSRPLRGAAAEEFLRSAGERPDAVDLVRAWSRGLTLESPRTAEGQEDRDR